MLHSTEHCSLSAQFPGQEAVPPPLSVEWEAGVVRGPSRWEVITTPTVYCPHPALSQPCFLELCRHTG